MRILALLLIPSALMSASPRDDLDAMLAACTGRDAARARVQLEVAQADGDDEGKLSSPGFVEATVESGADGVRMFWSREQLQAAEDGESPLRGVMTELSVMRVSNYLNAAPQILGLLKDAELLSDTPGDRDGRPVRVLSFKLNPNLGEKQRKYVKHLEANATLWLSEEGVPVAAERRVRVKGRVMLVIGFESEETERYRFTHRGDRLVVAEHTHESRGSGGGESNQRRMVARIALEEPPA